VFISSHKKTGLLKLKGLLWEKLNEQSDFFVQNP